MEKLKTKNSAYSLVKEIREVSDIKEVAQMLSSGGWIAIDATSGEKPTFVMGRVS